MSFILQISSAIFSHNLTPSRPTTMPLPPDSASTSTVSPAPTPTDANRAQSVEMLSEEDILMTDEEKTTPKANTGKGNVNETFTKDE